MELVISVSQQTFVWILKIYSLHFKIGASKKSIVFKHIFYPYPFGEVQHLIWDICESKTH